MHNKYFISDYLKGFVFCDNFVATKELLLYILLVWWKIWAGNLSMTTCFLDVRFPGWSFERTTWWGGKRDFFKRTYIIDITVIWRAVFFQKLQHTYTVLTKPITSLAHREHQNLRGQNSGKYRFFVGPFYTYSPIIAQFCRNTAKTTDSDSWHPNYSKKRFSL